MASNDELNPRTTRYEFLGPIGASLFITVLPLLVLFFAVCCNASGYPSQFLLADWKSYFADLLTVEFAKSLIDPMAMLVYVAFVGMLVVYNYVLNGEVVPGTKLRDGKTLKYRLNGKERIGVKY